MNAKEASDKIRLLLSENQIFYDDEKREMEQAITVLFKFCRGNAYLLEKCAQIKGWWKILASSQRLPQPPLDNQQLRRWIGQALETLESPPRLED
jgi:hypothetical protein